MLNGIGKILNSQLVVSHILINHTSRNIHRFIITYLLNDLSKALERFLKLINSMVHGAEMEPTAHKVFLQL